MMQDAVEPASKAARKAQLLRDGEFYRVGIVHAKQRVMHSLSPNAIMHHAFEHAVGFATHRIDSVLAPTGVRLQALVPYAVTALSLFARKKLLKPVLGIALVALAVGALLARYRR
jgi:hypothetical protein